MIPGSCICNLLMGFANIDEFCQKITMVQVKFEGPSFLFSAAFPGGLDTLHISRASYAYKHFGHFIWGGPSHTFPLWVYVSKSMPLGSFPTLHFYFSAADDLRFCLSS